MAVITSATDGDYVFASVCLLACGFVCQRD